MTNLTSEQIEFCERLREFCSNNDIGYGVLSRIGDEAGRFSKTNAFKLLNGTASPKTVDRVRPVLAAGLPQFLLDRGLTKTEVDEELSQLFDPKEYQKMLTNRRNLSPEIYRFFGLSEDPFDVDRLPDLDDLYTDKAIDTVFDRVMDAIQYHRFVAVSGPVGSGKTILKNRIADACDGGRSILIFPEFFEFGAISVSNIATEILAVLDQPIPRDRTRRVARIKTVLTDMQQQGINAAIVIDEAHRLDHRVITALKNFWELTNGRSARLLGVVIFCWPTLIKSTLCDRAFKEIRQRVQVVDMPPLNGSGMAYVAHRIKLAGGDADALFDPKALKRLCSSVATPLALGNLINSALIEAFEKEELRVGTGFDIFNKLKTDQAAARRAA